MVEKMTEQPMGEKKTEQPMGEKKTEQPIGEIETGAEILQKERHIIRECLIILVYLLYLASCFMALNYEEFTKKNDEKEAPRGYLWISSLVCVVIGTAFWTDIIIASIRYKVVIGGRAVNGYLLMLASLTLGSLSYTGYH